MIKQAQNIRKTSKYKGFRGGSQGSICVAGLHVVVLFPAKLCVGLLLVHGSQLLGYQPITNHKPQHNWRE